MKETKLQFDGIKAVFGFESRTQLKRPLLGSSLPAGFPSPATDYIEATLDLNEHLVRHPAATYFVRVEGDSMLGAGIHHDDILIVDRALEPANGRVVVAAVDGYLTVKRLRTNGPRWRLVPENPRYEEIVIEEGTDFAVWGVVTYVIHPV